MPNTPQESLKIIAYTTELSGEGRATLPNRCTMAWREQGKEIHLEFIVIRVWVGCMFQTQVGV